MPHADTKLEEDADTMVLADKCYQPQRLQKGSRNTPWGVCRVWASFLNDDKNLTQRSGGLSWEQWGGPGKGKKLTGFSKAPCQFCAQCLHSPGQVNNVIPGPCQSQGDKDDQGGGRGTGRRGTGREWGDTKQEGWRQSHPLLCGEERH